MSGGILLLLVILLTSLFCLYLFLVFFQREVGGDIEGGAIAIKTLWGDRD